jgi:hypothetical protein
VTSECKQGDWQSETWLRGGHRSTKGALRRLQQNVPDHIEVLKNRVIMIK